MIKIFEKVIMEIIAGQLMDKDLPLSFLKFSTATSGFGLNDKVIFLVFKNGSLEPFLCLKTVRNYGAKHAVLRNFKNLNYLNAVTAGSPYERLFARAVHLHDDGENVFSIETACWGDRIGQNKDKLSQVISSYTDFQVHLAGQNNGDVRSIDEIARETIAKSGLPELEQKELLEYFLNLPHSNIILPRIIQHGDLTPDNVLLSKEGFCVVDYDDVGNTDIPGFDLSCLFRRFDVKNSVALCAEYLPDYFKKIGGNFNSENYRGLLFLYNFIEYSQKKSHNFEKVLAKEVISGFERLYPKPSN